MLDFLRLSLRMHDPSQSFGRSALGGLPEEKGIHPPNTLHRGDGSRVTATSMPAEMLFDVRSLLANVVCGAPAASGE